MDKDWIITDESREELARFSTAIGAAKAFDLLESAARVHFGTTDIQDCVWREGTESTSLIGRAAAPGAAQIIMMQRAAERSHL
jgi:hypothetical protein